MSLFYLSGVFKLHQPSQRKRQVLDYVFREYTLALRDLLAYSFDNLDELRQKGIYRWVNKKGETVEEYTDKSIAPLLPSTRVDMASVLGEALVKNVSAMLASYLQLEKSDSQNPGFPVSRDPDPLAWDNALEELVKVGYDLESETLWRDRLTVLAHGEYMPIHYSRSRDFAILCNEDRTRFFAWLKLLPGKHPLGEKLTITDLVSIGQCDKVESGQVFTYRGVSNLLLPLEIGQNEWQFKKFLEPTLNREAVIKAAKLTKEGDDYFLHVSFGFEKPEKYKPECYLGIDRGVTHTVAYGLVDTKGRILDTAHSDDPFRAIRIRAGRRVQDKQQRGVRITKRDYKQKELDGILHRLVNDLIGIAQTRQAGIVLEDLNIQTKGSFYKSAYKKLAGILAYKAEMRGIPVKSTWAAYSSQICIHCGSKETERSEDRTTVICKECGSVEHADEAAGVNIARRILYKKADWENHFEFHKAIAGVGDLRGTAQN